MYRKDHLELARAIRDTAQADSSITPVTTKAFASAIAGVCVERTRAEGGFDREVFMAIAQSRNEDQILAQPQGV